MTRTCDQPTESVKMMDKESGAAFSVDQEHFLWCRILIEARRLERDAENAKKKKHREENM